MFDRNFLNTWSWVLNFAGIYFRWRSLHFRSLFSHTPTDGPHNMGWATIADRFWKILSKFVQKHYRNSLVSLVNQTLIFLLIIPNCSGSSLNIVQRACKTVFPPVLWTFRRVCDEFPNSIPAKPLYGPYSKSACWRIMALSVT